MGREHGCGFCTRGEYWEKLIHWRVLILPFNEETTLWNQLAALDPTTAGCSSTGWKNRSQHQREIAWLRCPSEMHRMIGTGYTGSYTPSSAARATYVASAGAVAGFPFAPRGNRFRRRQRTARA